MHSCYSFGVHLNVPNIDKTVLEDFESNIVFATGTFNQAQFVIAAINSGAFNRWLLTDYDQLSKEDKVGFDMFKFRPNKDGYTNRGIFNKWVRAYSRKISGGISSTTLHKSENTLDGFPDPVVKALALNYTADLIIENYYKGRALGDSLDIRSKFNANNILNNVVNIVSHNFVDAVETLIKGKKSLDKNNTVAEAKKTLNDEIINRNNDIAKNKDNKKEYNKLRKELSEYRVAFMKNEENKGKNVKEDEGYKAIVDKANKLKEEIDKLDNKISKTQETINSKRTSLIEACRKILDDNKLKEYEISNYGNLALNLSVNPDKWFTQTMELSKLLDLKRSFDEVLEVKKVEETSYADELDLTEILAQELDETLDNTDSWSDRLYKNYIKHFNGRLTLYLNSLHNLNSVNKIKHKNSDGTVIEDYDYNTDNALGVATTMDYRDIINNIVEFCKFTTVDDFIGSVEVLANKIPSMHGLIKMVDDMRNDRVFANFVAVNFGKGRVYKNMITIAESGITVAQSNAEAYQKTQIYNALLNNGKITLEAQYDIHDADEITNLLYQLNNSKNLPKDSEERAKLLINAADFITKYLNKMFPNIETKIFDKYFFGISNNQIEDAIVILNAINNFNSKINPIRDDIAKEKIRVRNINKAIQIKIDEAYANDQPLPNKQFEIFNPENVNYKSLNEPIAKLADIFSQMQTAKINLNSSTATNSLASDIIKSSWLTNLQKQLDDIIIDEKDPNKITYKGIELLKEFYDRTTDTKECSDNYYSSLLWGVRNPRYGVDKNEKEYLREGLFIRLASGATIVNPNARKLIKISLFTGIKNRNIDSGVPYDEMSKADYFLSGLHLYHSDGVQFESYLKEEEKSSYGNIMLRIPSDASNNYMMQVKKLSIDKLYTLNPNDVSKFESYKKDTFGVKRYLSLLNAPGNVKEIGQNLTARTLSIANDKEDKFKDRMNNISLDRMMQVLHDGGLQHLNTNKYVVYTNKEVEGKVVVPLICNSEQGKFIIWLAGDGNRRNAKNLSIVSICSAKFIGNINERPVIDGDAKPEEFEKQREAQLAWLTNPSNWANVSEMLTSAINSANQIALEYAFEDNAVEKQYNKNHVIYNSLRQEILGSFNAFVNAIDDVFEETPDGYKVKDSLKGLFEQYHYKDNSILKTVKDENGKTHLELAGNAFEFLKLFDIESNDGTIKYSAKEELIKALLLYGGDNSLFIEKNNTLYINPNAEIKLFNRVNKGYAKTIRLNVSAIDSILDNILSKWLSTYERYIANMAAQYSDIIGDTYTSSQIVEAILNQTIYYMSFDDILEGSSAFYKDAQTFLKRDKEVQMGGTPYSGTVDYRESMGSVVTKLKDSQNKEILIPLKRIKDGKATYENVNISQYNNGTLEENSVLAARNGWRAVTVANTKTFYEGGKYIYDSVKEKVLKDTGDEKIAEEVAENIANGYGYSSNGKYTAVTKANDAQSFITLEEWIRRRWADGTLEEYGDLPYKLLKGEALTAEDYENAKKIQICKNVYYDQQYDAVTGLHYGRQIKNAELVLIPSLLPKDSSFRKLYDLMHKYDIGQVNTLETSKAANHNVLEFWSKNNEHNEDGSIKLNENFENDLKDESNIETYYYKYLYKQQDFLDHLVDAENKAGVQFVKKLIDNASTIIEENKDDKVSKKTVQELVNDFQRVFSINIKESFEDLLIDLDWKQDANGNIVNKKDGSSKLDFTRFYQKFRTEAIRLNSDSNFLDYCSLNELGMPKMPNSMNNVSSKFESIAQSIFNSAITRQTLPGFHSIEFTGVGHMYTDVRTGERRELRYRPEVNGKRLPVVECASPAWSKDIIELVKVYGKEKALRMLQDAGLDEFIGYRIPTEGKQSIAIFKVVEILDDLEGSKLQVANDWITQTGADNDGDSIYTWTQNTVLKGSKDKNNLTIKKLNPDYDATQLYYNYIMDKARIYNERFVNNDNTLTKDEQIGLAKLHNQIKNIVKIKDKAEREKQKGFLIKLLNDIAKRCGFLTYNEFNKLNDESRLQRDVRNNILWNIAYKLLSNPAFSDEETFGRSQFEDLGKANSTNRELLGLSKKSRSVYNPFDQVDFMQNVIDGRGLKAISVNRDTGCSVCNRAKAELSKDDIITAEYYFEDGYNEQLIKKSYANKGIDINHEDIVKNGKVVGIKVYHKRIGWSDTNRNVIGKLITAYSSQTTAHILDAVKEGAIYNETNYTFGTFKTLIDVGIDYDTAIAFLMQPAITKLNEDYSRTNSIYSKTYNDPVNNVIRAWAINNNIKVNGDFVTEYTPINEIYKAIRLDANIKKIYFEKFGIDISDTNKVPSLNKRLLKERLKEEADKTKVLDDNQKLEREVFDLGIILMFNKFRNTTTAYENNLKVTRPDSFGAKQTVRATRKIVSDATDYAKGVVDKKETDGMRIVVKKDDEYIPFIDALYPGLKDDGVIKIKDSVYPSLASFFSYATQLSVNISKRLFITEGNGFYNFINGFEKSIGRSLTDDEVKKFKKYIISSIYQTIPILCKPITINEHGQFVDDKASQLNNPIDYWNSEISRIGGYVENADDYFVVKDPSNPNDEELEKFNKLTPLQKVIYIKQTFPDDCGIFAFINTIKAYGKEIKEKGYSVNRLTVNVENTNIENLFVEFNKCFFNSNKLVKSAAFDLIKYAFVVEGFDFRKGTITKIVANDVLLAEINDGGTGIITEYNTKMFNIFGDVDAGSEGLIEASKESFYDEFIRANSEIIKTTRFGKATKNSDFDINKAFNSKEIIYKSDKSQIATGMYYIPNDENNENKAIIEKLCKFIPADELGYKNLEFYKNDKFTSVLFKIKPNIAGNTVLGYWLMPLNKLEKFEYGKWSKNNRNNIYYSLDFYEEIIKLLPDGTTDYSVSEIKDLDKYDAPIYNKITHSDLENPDNLINIVEDLNADPKDKAVAQDILNKAAEWYDTKSSATVLGYIQNTAKQFGRLTGLNYDKGSCYINVPTKNGIVTLELMRETTGLFNKYYQKQTKGEYFVGKDRVSRAEITLTPEQKKFYDSMQYHSDRGAAYDGVYIVKTVITEKQNQNLIDSAKAKAENFEKENPSRYEAPNNWHRSTTKSFDTFSEIANLIAEEFKTRDKRGDTKAHDALSTLSQIGVSFDTLANISKSKENIYKVAADYYEQLADDILKELDNFVIDKVYSVTDDELYAALREHPEFSSKLYNLILRAKCFGKELQKLTQLHIEGEDDETTKSINRLINAITKVQSNTKVRVAIDHIYNSYLAYEYSKNPNIKMGIVDITTAFGDTDFFDTWIGDILNIDNKQIQLIVKLANDELNQAKMDSISAIDEFDDWWEQQIDKFGKERFDEILKLGFDEHGKFIAPYVDKFLEDRSALISARNEAKEKYGVYSLEYQKAKLKYDKFKAAYTHQPIIDTYYIKRNQYKEAVLRDAGDLYIQYIELQDQLYNKYGDIDELTPDELIERRKIQQQLVELKTEFNSDGTSKTTEQINKIRALADYLKNTVNLEKEYKEVITSQEYKDNIDKYKSIIKDWKEKYPNKTVVEIYNENPDSEFTEAYDWIRNNANFTLTDDGWRLMQEQYDKLYKNDDIVRNAIDSIIKRHQGDVYDVYGTIIGTRFSDAEQEQIKKIMEDSYNPFREADANKHLALKPESSLYTPGSDTVLIKEVPETPVLTKEFYDTFFKGESNPNVFAKKCEVYTKINKLLIKGVDKAGHISPKQLAANLTNDELQQLADYYAEVRNLNKEQAILNKSNPSPKGPFDYESAPLSADVISEINSFGGLTRALLNNIFYEYDSDGALKYSENALPLGNKLIYGYIQMNKDASGEYTAEAKKYIDFDKTEANKWLTDNVIDDVTDYYKLAKAEAEANGTYDEWHARNHVWNPYKHNWEPTKIWKVRKPTETGVLAKEYDFIPTSNNTEKQVKSDYVNKKCTEEGYNYKRNGVYDNANYNLLSEDELKVIDHFKQMATEYATSSSAKAFLKQGYAPRSYHKDADLKWWAEQAASTFGFKPKAHSEAVWHEHLDYNSAPELPFSMFSLLKDGNSKPMLKKPSRIDFPTGAAGDAAYSAKLAEVEAANKKIAADNLAIDNSILDRDWKSVFRKLIQYGYENNAKNNIKDLLFLTLEDIRERKGIEVDNRKHIFGDVIRSVKRSKPDYNSYYEYENENTAKIFENWVRRYLYNEFHKPSALRTGANAMQSFVSAQYMIANIRGGIANIGTGLVNMFGDSFSGIHFDKADLKAGIVQYTKNIPYLLDAFINDDTPNKTVGMIDFFDVVDTDEFNETARGDKKADASKIADKANSILYGANGAGEHFMQNATLLAMTKSHRVYLDKSTNKVTIGSISDYTRMIDVFTFKEVLKLNANGNNGINGAALLYSFENSFMENIKKDASAVRKYDRFNADIVTDFIRSSYVDPSIRRKLAKQYIELRKANYKSDLEEFQKLTKLEDRIGYDEKHRHITILDDPNNPDLKLTNRQLAEFKGKVLEVNKIIHGVYDKMGAAMIEKHWFGSLIMQYHKHMYPGYLKRWRKKGIFDETIGFQQYGSGTIIAELLQKDNYYHATFDEGSSEKEKLGIFAGIWNWFVFTLKSIVDIGINYQMLPMWEQQLIKKRIGDYAGQAAALLTALALYSLVDKDKLKNDKYIATILYLADRLYTESRMYNLGAIPTEARTLWSSPIACWTTIQDLYKAGDYIYRRAFDPSFNPITKNGKNKGKDKFVVLVRKHTPILRIWDRFQNAAKNNSYFRVGESTNGMNIMRQWGFNIRPYIYD